MHWVGSLALFLAAATALAGCTADSGTDSVDADAATPAASATPSVLENVTENATANRAPTANLTADLTDGTAPLNVTFTLSGSDADGDNLTWTLSFGDGEATNGTTLPANVTHSFTAAGNYTVTLAVSDGTNTTEASVVVEAVEAAAEAAGEVVDPTRCDRTPTQWVNDLYVFEGDGGNWIFIEANGIEGLQVENNHVSEEAGLAETIGEHNALWEGCLNGDQMVF